MGEHSDELTEHFIGITEKMLDTLNTVNAAVVKMTENDTFQRKSIEQSIKDYSAPMLAMLKETKESNARTNKHIDSLHTTTNQLIEQLIEQAKTNSVFMEKLTTVVKCVENASTKIDKISTDFLNLSLRLTTVETYQKANYRASQEGDDTLYRMGQMVIGFLKISLTALIAVLGTMWTMTGNAPGV